MAVDRFPDPALDSPAIHAVAVSKSDTTLLDPVPRALYVGGAGDLVVDMLGGETGVTFSSVPAGSTLAIRAVRVKAATTASNVVALS
jgi:hypothetical protein